MSGDERERLAALHEYRLLDAPADDELEAVVRVAAMVAGVPTATLNLIDENRQCQLTTTGFEGGDSPRADSMCAIRFETGEFTYVRDASLDPVYAANPWVTGLLADVRFYASAPLVTPQGHALGTLCVFDSQPRELDAEQIARLKDLAQVILALFERRRQARVNAGLLAEAEARQEFTDAVLETIDVAVVAADPSGHLSMFNRAGRAWHGLDADASLEPEELPERYQLFRADGVTPLPADEIPLLCALRDGSVHGAEMIIRPSGIPPRHVVASGRAMTSPGGTPLGAVVAMTDVTADRAQRRALEQAHTDLAATIAELQRSNLELEQFAGVVSHDLAAPLAVVNGYLELLSDEYGDRLDPQAQKWMGSATRAIARMQGLISALLTYARAGSEPCRREKTDLGEIAGQALSDLRDSVADVGAEVTVAADLPRLDVDPTLMRQLLQNLVANAVKYRHPDRPARIEVAAVPRGDDWLVTVTDNGIGIAESQRRRVFEMFAQVEPGARAGYGVGLSTCQRIVERHGGRIWADATPGGGTTIAFTLPGA
ncbi:ATP-binding protein [Actinoplanes sp. NPDC049681]|uniref:sensor histidine kinase n=1 Tax=Actinoplanes sp. NPDC049681 TaxID=3363905 RepID=UPI0037BD7AE0